MCNAIGINAKNESEPEQGLDVAAESKDDEGKKQIPKGGNTQPHVPSHVQWDVKESDSNNSGIHLLCFLSISLPNEAPTQPPTASILRISVLLRSEHKEIHDPLGVTPFVIVPCDKLNKVFVQLDTSAGIEDRGRIVAKEVRRHDRVFCVFDNALEVTAGGILDGLLDLLIGSFFLCAHDKIDD